MAEQSTGLSGRNRKLGIGIVLVIVIGLVGFSVLTNDQNDNLSQTPPENGPLELNTAPERGALAPDFTLQNLSGEEITLSDLRGKMVLINLWATWCGPCRLEMPAFEDKYQELEGEGFVVLAVNFDESAEDVADFRDELGLTFELLLDPGGEVQKLYRNRTYPSSFFVGPDGVIQIQHIGVMTEGQLDGYLADLGFGS